MDMRQNNPKPTRASIFEKRYHLLLAEITLFVNAYGKTRDHLFPSQYAAKCVLTFATNARRIRDGKCDKMTHEQMATEYQDQLNNILMQGEGGEA